MEWSIILKPKLFSPRFPLSLQTLLLLMKVDSKNANPEVIFDKAPIEFPDVASTEDDGQIKLTSLSLLTPQHGTPPQTKCCANF